MAFWGKSICRCLSVWAVQDFIDQPAAALIVAFGEDVGGDFDEEGFQCTVVPLIESMVQFLVAPILMVFRMS